MIFIKNKFRISSGFTLVELLIVITLIAILSVAVIATINPIQQTNKARDARYAVVVGELLGALERYYSSQNTYPWNVTSYDEGLETGKIMVGAAAGFSSTDRRLGVVPKADGSKGELLITSEVKGSFEGQQQFQSSAGLALKDKIYVYNDGGMNTFACFCPKATTGRLGESGKKLKCLIGYDANSESGNAVNVSLLDIGDVVSGKNCLAPVSGKGERGAENANFCDPGFGTSGGLTGDYVANMQCVPDGSVTLN
jgi:prepilin-type N-terminal cleavage/methylation domain-containing protein